MSQIRDLDNVIRRVPEGTEGDGRTTFVVTIDGKSGQVVQRPGPYIFNRNYLRFLVSNRRDAHNIARGVVHFAYRESLAASNTVEIDMFYETTCPPDNEKKVAQALYAGPHPAAVLNDLITTWVQEYVRSKNIPLIESYFQAKNDLERYVGDKAMEVIGLDLKADLVIPGYPEEVTVKDCFPVRVNDYNTEQTISVNIELEVDHRNIVRAILHKNYPIGELIRRDIRKYFADKVSLHQFYFSLNEKRLRDEVKAHLDKSLKSVGRTVAFVSLERDATIPTPPRSFKCECDISYRISEDSSSIKITNKVLLELQDAAKYVIARSPDLYQWVKKNLEDALSRELFRATYLDLLLRFEPFKDLVRQRISREASSIGYDIKHLIADPDLEPKRWLKEGIEIKTKEAEEEYETNISKFPVRLSIVVNTLIKDLEGIKQYLHPPQDVPLLMKNAILDDTARFLRTVDPKLFHLRFSMSADPNETPLEETLRKRISALIKRDFNAGDHSITLRAEETEIGRLFQVLNKQVSEFEVTVASHNTSQPEDIVVKGNFTVESLDYNGWEKFRSRKPSVADIRKLLENSIRTRLENHANDYGRFTTSDEIERASEIIRSSARQTILENYGLEISVDNIGRDKTPFSTWLNAKALEAMKDRINQALEQQKQMEAQLWVAKQERFEAKAAGASDDQVKEFDKRILMLEEEIRNVAASIKGLLLSSSNGASNRPAIPERKDVRQLYGPSAQHRFDDEEESANDNPSL